MIKYELLGLRWSNLLVFTALLYDKLARENRGLISGLRER